MKENLQAPETNAEKKYYTISAITKACTVLDMLAAKQSWDLAELARAAKLPKTTVHRILLTFEDSGYVQQEQHSKRYYLSHKVFTLANAVLAGTNLREMASPHCKDLLAQFNETVNLCVVSGIDMVIVDKHVTTQTLRPDNIVGSSFPIFYSASGKAFLAFSDPAYYHEILPKIKNNTLPAISEEAFQAFLEEIEEVKKTGIAFDNEEIYQGVRCISAPIFDFSEHCVGAISVTAPTVRLTSDLIEKMSVSLLKTARNISLRLGSSNPLFKNGAD